MAMWTRKEYMGKECTHDEYYGQFVTPWTIRVVTGRIPADRIVRSTDPHFNDIALSIWDTLVFAIQQGYTVEMKEAGLDNSIASAVCVAKAAARKIKKEGEQDGKGS